MVKEVNVNGKVHFLCEECEFLYEDEDWAKKCEAWCRKNHSCSLKITEHAVKN